MSAEETSVTADLKIPADGPVGETELIRRLKKREPVALSETVSTHSRPLYRAALGMGFRPEEAEDLVQDVFIVFLDALERFEGRSKVRTWLFGILHRKALERRRSRMREERHDSCWLACRSCLKCRQTVAERPDGTSGLPYRRS